jgi:hypothetical protein
MNSFSLFNSFQFFTIHRTIFELKDFVETKSRETDYEALKGNCVKVKIVIKHSSFFPFINRFSCLFPFSPLILSFY